MLLDIAPVTGKSLVVGELGSQSGIGSKRPNKASLQIIFNLGQQYRVITNIRRADVSESKGWVLLELEGEEQDIEQGIAWVTSKGVRVDPIAGDIVEG